jgi:hypothetical protein
VGLSRTERYTPSLHRAGLLGFAHFAIDAVPRVTAHQPHGLGSGLGRKLGIATIYFVCDFVDDAMAACVDRTATVTAYLRSLYSPTHRG